ncbi:MAG: S-layer homology domain-containing protein [Butyricicoccus sp.]|nr:S-layer homology domain-containing protein [Butyricicoccus sp.]
MAILVKDDGTEEIIKTSPTTENSVVVILNDGETVKLVDNSKDFADVSDTYWAADAIDFATSRELFAGTSATTFELETAMTRGMIVTVLARFESVATTIGSTWYETGQQWTMENGISDGTNMDNPLTREQLVAMLYRSQAAPAFRWI